MYLFVFSDHTIRQVADNITVAELLAMQEHSLRVFQFIGENFVELIVDNGKPCLVPVREGKVFQCKDGRFHQ
jgi:hypothetical protein